MSQMTTVRIDRYLPGGSRLARDDQGAIIIDDGVPGDLVALGPIHKKRGARFAQVAAVITGSADRVAADCRHHPRCGGCNWLDARYASHGDHKRTMVLDALRRIGRCQEDELSLVRDTLSPQNDQGQRRRARMVVDHNGRLSFAAAKSHDRIAVDHCAALAPRLNDLLGQLRSARLRVGATVHLSQDDDGVVAAAESASDAVQLAPWVRGVLVAGREPMGDPFAVGEVTSGRFPARSDALAFTQATRFGGAAILDAVLSAVPPSCSSVVELFAGSGHLTLPLAARGHQLFVVEGDGHSIHHLRHNMGLTANPNVEIVHAHIDGELTLPPASVLLVDPPRSGMIDFAAMLARVAPDVVVMVSCDPATGARDLALAKGAGFGLVDLVPIDAFPRTHHVEWVATLHRRPSSL
jgi:23S rRNA (uracil1939-C5)-methyltransferase